MVTTTPANTNENHRHFNWSLDDRIEGERVRTAKAWWNAHGNGKNRWWWCAAAMGRVGGEGWKNWRGQNWGAKVAAGGPHIDPHVSRTPPPSRPFHILSARNGNGDGDGDGPYGFSTGFILGVVT